ncbi:carboxypeptidase-like regulatory domain-containing protein [Fibrivirga algicola]|uniref:TonB-dependent receptor plug domain-containing protein n=1 Tax=Fibrivirga algicola TaxID=2950420 RepID=A0ABX0QPD5_9BACT|nr:carboxypeptidase-like regulatory domain-containing protein [Fibrivirga algicola]NID12737.1 TonB-dependent receptor plug domain-containing protein [Fibrivirga algicola]
MHSRLALLFISQFVLVGLSWAQGPQPVTGRVFDGETNQPVPFASVYVNASTRGTTADADGKYQLPGVPSGTVELVASAVGYETVRQLLKIGDVKNRRINFLLKPDAIGLKAVTVTAKRSAAYNRMLKQFKRELLGDNATAEKCQIINEGVVSLSMSEGHLQATSPEPLVIENTALGYRLVYQLLYFDSFRGATYYGGVSRFEPLKATNAEQTERWERNRQRAYLGSGRHLLASLQAGTYEQEGFLVFESNYVLSADISVPIARFGKEPPTKAAQPDSLFTPAELPSERIFYSKKPLEVFYTRQRAATPYRDLPYAYSLVYMPRGGATVTTEGWVVHPNGMEMRGALSADRLATLLPADWQPAAKKQNVPTATPDQGVVLPPDAVIDSLAANWRSAQTGTAPTLFLHTDKGLYGTGDQLWFSGYSLDPATSLPADQAVTAAELPLHVELIAPGGRLVAHQWVRVSAGRTSGSIRLSDSLATGQYTLRAYTEADRENVQAAFERAITVVNGLALGADVRPGSSTSPVDVQFLPEGGRWVAGLPTVMGIKAVDRRGRGIAVSGQILSAEGGEVGRFQTNTLGLGRVDLVPQANQTYLAQVRWAGDSALVPLPAVDPTGLTLATDIVTDSTRLAIQVRASGALATQPVYLTVQSRGQLIQQLKVTLQQGKARLAIPAVKLPVGVAQVTLFDAQGHPQAERLVFIPDRFLPLVADVTTNKPIYALRESVTLSLRVADGFGDQVAMIGSAVVTDAQQVPADSVEATIRTHLLLTGELRGRVEHPNEYLISAHPARRRALDNLLLTQGWRRISWHLMDKPTTERPPVMAGMLLKGTVFNKKNRPLPEANLLLTFAGNADNAFARTARTDKQGHFLVDNLFLTDTATVAVRAMTADFKTIADTRVTLDVPGHQFGSVDSVGTLALAPLQPFVTAIQQRQASDLSRYRMQDVRQLKEVVVKTRRLDDDREARRVSLHGTPDATVIFDENARTFNNAYEMLRGRVPGVQVASRRDGQGGYSVTVRGPSTFGANTAPLYLVDGMPLTENDNGTALLMVNVTEVERIEVLKNGGGAIYGSRGGAGVIAFFSKKGPAGTSKEAEQAAPQLMVYGLQTDRQFYTPRYTLPADSTASQPDRRDVLYWKPMLATSLSGFSTIAFPLSDQARTIRLRIQGVTTYGRPVVIDRLINVR